MLAFPASPRAALLLSTRDGQDHARPGARPNTEMEVGSPLLRKEQTPSSQMINTEHALQQELIYTNPMKMRS